MMNLTTTKDSDGERAARARRRRHWWTTGLALLGGIGVSLIFLLGKAGPGHVQPDYAIAAVIVMALVLPLAIHFNDRSTDELDRMNILKANSFGLYISLFAGWSWLVLWTGDLVPPPNLLILIAGTGLITLGRYWMLRFQL